jgi:hypothetical protein
VPEHNDLEVLEVLGAGTQRHELEQAAEHQIAERPGQDTHVLLLLRAFGAGATSMTGVETVSNAVAMFQPEQWRNARATLSWIIGLLICLFVGADRARPPRGRPAAA